MFWFDFQVVEMPRYNAHVVSNNIFEHLYCRKGCAYYATGNQVN